MITTPMDIFQREFTRKSIGGLDENEVYSFLKKIGREYETLYAENKALKDQAQRLSGQMQDYMTESQDFTKDFLEVSVHIQMKGKKTINTYKTSVAASKVPQ